MSFKKSDVILVIKSVLKDIENEPFIVHCEQDIHSMLYCRLNEKNHNLYPIDLQHRRNSVKNKNGHPFRTNLVHSEYFFGKDDSGIGTYKRFDLVIFDENDVKNITRNWLTRWTNDGYDIIALKHVIEIKFEFGDGGPDNRNFDKSLSKKDVDKLVKFRGLQKKNRNIDPILYFIYVLRWLTNNKAVKEEILNFIKKLEKYCAENDVNFIYSVNFLID